MEKVSAQTGLDDSRRLRLCLIALFLLSLLQYSYSFKNAFVFDSRDAFVNETSIRDLGNIPGFFSEPFHTRKLDGSILNMLGYYRPLVKTLHAVEFKAFGENPIGYNTVNIIFNALAVCVGFLLINSITGNIRVAMIASTLYAVNPARVPAVSWAYSDSYTLMSLLCFTSIYLYHHKRYIASAIAFTASLLCRESTVLLPIILVLYEFLVRESRTIKAYMRILPYLVLIFIYLAIRSSAVGAIPVTAVDPLTLLNTVVVIIKRYVKIFFLPDGPITFYNRTLFTKITTEVAVSYVTVAGLIAIGVWMWKRRRHYLFWYLWFFVWMIVNFNVGKFGESLMGDKLLNDSALGLCAVIGYASQEARFNRKAVAALLTIALLSHFAITYYRTLFWRTEELYFTEVLKFAPDNYIFQNARGKQFADQGKYELAIEYFKRTIELDPGLTYAYNNMGMSYYMLGDNENAFKAWQRAVETDPMNAQANFNLGFSYERLGNMEKALYYYKRYVDTATPPDPNILNHIAGLEAQKQ